MFVAEFTVGRRAPRASLRRLRRAGARLTAVAFAQFFLVAGFTPVSAQENCAQFSNPEERYYCERLTSDQSALLQTFAGYPNSPAGKDLLDRNLAAIEAIYAGATQNQRDQAKLNQITGPFITVQANLWGMISTSSAYPLNASSFTNFPSVAINAPLATTIVGEMSDNAPPQVYTKIEDVLAKLRDHIEQIGTLKDNFHAYNDYYVQQLGLVTSWGGSVSDPFTNDLRPYQVSKAIADNPFTNPDCATASPTTNCLGWDTNQTVPSFPSGHSIMGNTSALYYAMLMPQAYQSMMVSAQQFGLSRNILGVHYPLDIIGGRVLSYYLMTQLMAGEPLYADAYKFYTGGDDFATQFKELYKDLQEHIRDVAGASAIAVPYADCAGAAVANCIANGVFPTASALTAANQAYVSQSTYGLPSILPASSGNVAPANSNLLIASRFPYLSSSQQLDILTSTLLPAGVPLDDGSGWARLNLYAAAGGYGAFNSGTVSVTMDASKNGFHAIDFWTNNISGSGGLALSGSGTLVLGGDNTYTGGTTVGCAPGIGCATLALSGTMVGDLTTMRGASFVTGGGYQVAPGSTLVNGGVFQSVNASLVNLGTLSNTGDMLSNLVNGGDATNAGVIFGNVYNFGFFSNANRVNGDFVNAGVLAGGGEINGDVLNGGAIAPGDSIDTLTIAGDYTQQAGGSYQVQVQGDGGSDLIQVGGAAVIQGGAVNVYAMPSSILGMRTTYRIVNAAGGLSGAYASVNENYPFLQSSLSCDSNGVYLNTQVGGFAAAARTQTQLAVGAALDAGVNMAIGDFAAVLGALAVNTTSNAQAQAALTALSGNEYAAFSSAMVQGAQLFMNNFANMNNFADQASRGSTNGAWYALAEPCKYACDATSRPVWSVWGGPLGGLGSIGADGSTGKVTYNFGGFAAGVDRTITPNVRVGVTAGYLAGSQWIGGFNAKGGSDTVLAGLYGGYAEGPIYADALAGYAYSANKMWRNISLPGLPQRAVNGVAGANQFYGQAETGYRIDIGAPANAYVTPFARLQAYTGVQNALSETGGQSINLRLARQTANSARTVIGAQVGGFIDLGWREKLALQFRLNWSHEFADTARPVSASFVGAPLISFTTYGIAPRRDGAVVGFSANTAVATATSLYFRYDGNFSDRDNAHAFTGGVRMAW
ncbi:autotransporter domain-containing protein [Methylocystis sp.]|uniref:autotransporter domain-containing protein n=1 Tax=Methylocystis sp. TaxID=1911079 RepID=UPI003D0DB6DD